MRDEVVEFISKWYGKVDIKMQVLLKWIGISAGKYSQWQKRYGKENLHNSWLIRDFWLTQEEKEQIRFYYALHHAEGYRRLTYMMIDEDKVAVSPASVYRVLSESGDLAKKNCKPSKKGTGFKQPQQVHKDWHIDISYLNICGTFYYLCAIIDGYSRYLVGWDIREQMQERDVEIILERAKESFPLARPTIISDNGPQFIATEFKEFIRISGMNQITTSPGYPQSNGKIERWNQTVKTESLRQKCPLSLEDACRIVREFVDYYNHKRLHSAIGYIPPVAKLEGWEESIQNERKKKLALAKARRKEVNKQTVCGFSLN